ncbi:unnamed protein product [Pylaiella littoralis]
MKTTVCFAAAACLTAAPLLVKAQMITVSVASCDDLPTSAITQDTVLELTATEISCDVNTALEITNGASLQMISSEQGGTTINNIKIWVQDGTFLCDVPNLEWTSVETVSGIHNFQVRGGAAMRTEEDTSATFVQDVAFIACELPAEDFSGGSEGAAIANFGSLVFQGNTVFRDTPDAGALYTWGSVTFEKDATFDNNKSNANGEGGGSGAGLYIDSFGIATFKGATYFTNNEVIEDRAAGGDGAALFSVSSSEEAMVFSGPVTVSGNSGAQGAITLWSGQSVIFESLVTFTDNIMAPKLYGDSSLGGAMWVTNYGGDPVEFLGGVTATGNSAKNGGVFYLSNEASVILSAPVNISGNEARLAGGVFWMGRGATVTLPVDSYISGNTATICPGFNIVEGEVVFDEGETFTAGTKDLCYFGNDATGSAPVDLVEEFDCEAYSAIAPVTNEHPYLVLDTAAVKSWDFGSGGGFSCDTQLIVYVTGGEELTVTSTAASSTMSNVHLEVIGYTSLVLDVPDLTMSGIFQSQVGGAVFVEDGSSLDIVNDITFQSNSIQAEYSLGQWVPRGGAAIFSAGTTTFHGRAEFFGNGQYEADANGYEPSNEDGGALSNSGTMTFMKRGRFIDSFNPNGGNGGAISNFGDLTFNLRAIFTNNSAGVAYTDDGEPGGGRGGAVWNKGESSTILFNGVAIFKDNVGALGGCALASKGWVFSENDDDLAAGDNKITFADKAKFKDNYCDGEYPTIYDDRDFADWADNNKGGGAILAYGATSIEFANTAVFKRNEGPNGGAITNSAEISFISDAKLVTADNVVTGTLSQCSDILNNDVGTIVIGTEAITGASDSLCERTAAT